MTPQEKILLQFIQIRCKGQENALTGIHLANVFGCDKRKIQREIEQLRIEGFPVLSSCLGDKGYFWPNPKALQEAEECFRQMSNRAAHTFKSLSHIKNGMEKTFGSQIEFDFGEV